MFKQACGLCKVVGVIAIIGALPLLCYAKGRAPVAPLIMKGAVKDMKLGRDGKGDSITQFLFSGRITKAPEADGKWEFNASVDNLPVEVYHVFFYKPKDPGSQASFQNNEGMAHKCLSESKTLSIEMWAPVVYIDQVGIMRLKADDAHIAGCQLDNEQNDF